VSATYQYLRSGIPSKKDGVHSKEGCVSTNTPRGAGPVTGGIAEQRFLAVCHSLGILGNLDCVLVQQKKCLTFNLPSPITVAIPDSADLKHNCAYQSSMWRDRGGIPTSAWRLRTGVAL
jgi:hypothetical protein